MPNEAFTSESGGNYKRVGNKKVLRPLPTSGQPGNPPDT